ncbi:MAG: hypothetical protein KC445_08910 [Anaerolineales bacterium]|nr:hypothetical protein [Anaerolineales bacterium]
MEEWRCWFKNLSTKEMVWLTAVFLSAMLGTFVSSLVLHLGFDAFGYAGVLAKLGVCILATASYGGAVVAVFSILLPETKLAFKQLLTSKK